MLKGKFEVKQEWVPLFYTATWMIRIYVNDKMVWESEGKDQAWEPVDIEAAVRKYLRDNVKTLVTQGIKVTKEFAKWSEYHSMPTDIS